MTGQKIANLKIAADRFVDTILTNDEHHRVSISIVPYNAQVNIGPDLVSKFNITDHNNVANVNCVEIPVAAYATGPLSLTAPMPMMAYADIAHTTSRVDSYVSETGSSAVPNYSNTYCKPTTVNMIRLPNNDAATLKSQIDALQAGGNTSITLGMKWGLTMIDPAMRPVYADFADAGKIPSTMPGRPFEYADPDTTKIIVLMTDGEHVSHNRINDGYKTGPSPIYRSTGDGRYSVHHTTGRPAAAGTNEYYVPHLGSATTAAAWRATPWNSGGGVVQQNWETIWANLRMPYVAWQFYGRALGTNSAGRDAKYNAMVTAFQSTFAEVDAMDAQLQTSCDQAKAQGVTVYGVTVEAPEHGQQVISACSTSTSHYFEATAANIDEKFASIAANITQLRLTQ